MLFQLEKYQLCTWRSREGSNLRPTDPQSVERLFKRKQPLARVRIDGMSGSNKLANGVIITTDEASIKTASIEVKVIKIGNKQVTLAVFRQLPEEPVINSDTGELKGVPWGRVNYHVDCENIRKGHLHVVWQKGNELRRCVPILPWWYESYIRTSWGEINNKIGRGSQAYVAAHILEGWKPQVLEDTVPYLTSDKFTVDFGQYKDAIYLNTHIQTAWTRFTSGEITIQNYKRDELRKLIVDVGFPVDSIKIKDILLPFLREREELTQIWKQSYAQLEQLDQLFIAV